MKELKIFNGKGKSYKKIICSVVFALCPPAHAVSCKDFATHAQAQTYFNAKKPGYKKLDGDKDGKACVCRAGSGRWAARGPDDGG